MSKTKAVRKLERKLERAEQSNAQLRMELEEEKRVSKLKTETLCRLRLQLRGIGPMQYRIEYQSGLNGFDCFADSIESAKRKAQKRNKYHEPFTIAPVPRPDYSEQIETAYREAIRSGAAVPPRD